MTNTPPENLLVHVLKLLVNRVYALAYVQATQCLYVGGDFSGLVYRADDGYSTSVPVSTNLRRVCRQRARPAGANFSANQPLGDGTDASTLMVWDDVRPDHKDRSGLAMRDPVRVLLADGTSHSVFCPARTP
jgi:hypothetical protein